eukprot:4556081-Amphidinium_carterae.1
MGAERVLRGGIPGHSAEHLVKVWCFQKVWHSPGNESPPKARVLREAVQAFKRFREVAHALLQPEGFVVAPLLARSVRDDAASVGIPE